MSDQKCIYQYSAGNFCGVIASDHTGVHFFQPPLEISAEAVEAAMSAYSAFMDENFPDDMEYNCHRQAIYPALEAALRVMQKGQDE
jgi:hypothetical protein